MCLCSELKLNSYDDWFLPSEQELLSIYKNLISEGIGNFYDAFYWSSTESLNPDPNNPAFKFMSAINFNKDVTQGGGNIKEVMKYEKCHVRAIRAF